MFIKKLQPLYQPPCEITITKRMKAKYEELKLKVKEELKKADSKCLTTDIWTHQHTMCSYLGITAHYLKDYEMTTYELGAYYLTERKTIPYLIERLNEICKEWVIDKNKISAVLSDGGANIKGAIKKHFGEPKHVSCIGHTLNNVGQSLIEVDITQPASESDQSEMLKSLDENDSDTENIADHNQKSQLRNLLVKKTNQLNPITTVGKELKKSMGSLVKEEVKVSKNLAIECDSRLAIGDQQSSNKDKNFCDFLDQAVQSSNQYNDNDEAGGVPIELRQHNNYNREANMSNYVNQQNSQLFNYSNRANDAFSQQHRQENNYNNINNNQRQNNSNSATLNSSTQPSFNSNYSNQTYRTNRSSSSLFNQNNNNNNERLSNNRSNNRFRSETVVEPMEIGVNENEQNFQLEGQGSYPI
ncbi:homeobox protein 2-like [Bactrocera dorsalis]|uniref:Homeobox protein 2-like n=1 Tax=Bactrocera dorsalis TaxID=27457 RepID=A0ABM3JIC7_BACDO|nr:homeobox protein 2-like [Bactrocera dorsalis]